MTGCPGWGPLVPVLSAACSKRLSSVMGPRRPSYRERLWAQHNSVQERGPIPRMRRTSEAAMYGFRSHPSPPAGGQATRGPRLPAPTAPQSGREARRRPRWLQPPTPRRMSKKQGHTRRPSTSKAKAGRWKVHLLSIPRADAQVQCLNRMGATARTAGAAPDHCPCYWPCA